MIFEVKTTGVCEAKPNLITFNLRFVYKDEVYEKAVDGIAKDIIEFHKLMKDYAKPEDFKTLRYSVERETKRVEHRNKKGETEYKYVFSHYEATQRIKLEIAYDKVKLFEIVQLVSQLGDKAPTVNFAFGLTDDAIAKLENECTEKALFLAKEKANAVVKSLKMNKAYFTKTSIVESFETYRTMESDTCYKMAAERCLMSRDEIEDMAESMEPEDVRVEINMISEFEIV